jgi:hypothetical protein
MGDNALATDMATVVAVPDHVGIRAEKDVGVGIPQ